MVPKPTDTYRQRIIDPSFAKCQLSSTYDEIIVAHLDISPLPFTLTAHHPIIVNGFGWIIYRALESLVAQERPRSPEHYHWTALIKPTAGLFFAVCELGWSLFSSTHREGDFLARCAFAAPAVYIIISNLIIANKGSDLKTERGKSLAEYVSIVAARNRREGHTESVGQRFRPSSELHHSFPSPGPKPFIPFAPRTGCR